MTKVDSDGELLREYARNRSEGAFAEMVARHGNWVYSAALRTLGDSHAAEDVTQTVFFLLSQQPEKAVGKSLAGWLFQVMRYSVANLIRAEKRRSKHEAEAAKMVSETVEQDANQLWDHLSPRLDELMGRLRLRDREVLLLRFYRGKSIAQIGEELNITEDAARKRMSTALEELRRSFGFRGAAVPAAAMGALLLANTTHAAPTSLIAMIGSSSAAPSASVIGLADAVRRMILLGKMKVAAIVLFFAALLPGAAVASFHLAFQSPPQAVAPPVSPPSVSLLPPAASGVQYEVGNMDFLPGDKLTITDIQGTAGTIIPGNTYTIKGTYELSSRNQATVGIYNSAMNAGENDNGPYGKNSVDIQAGKGTFTLNLTMRIEGYPHVSFYPGGGGGPFGNLYFGTGKYVLRGTVGH